jgi:hypothetical protein
MLNAQQAKKIGERERTRMKERIFTIMHNRHYLSFVSILSTCFAVNDRFTFLFFFFFFLNLFCYVSNMREKKKRKKDFFRSWSYDDNDDGDEHLYSIIIARNPTILHIIYLKKFFFFFCYCSCSKCLIRIEKKKNFW